ncbi:MAG: hypothetical protein ACOX8R_04245 [Bacillota bacterium]
MRSWCNLLFLCVCHRRRILFRGVDDLLPADGVAEVQANINAELGEIRGKEHTAEMLTAPKLNKYLCPKKQNSGMLRVGYIIICRRIQTKGEYINQRQQKQERFPFFVSWAKDDKEQKSGDEIDGNHFDYEMV